VRNHKRLSFWRCLGLRQQTNNQISEDLPCANGSGQGGCHGRDGWHLYEDLKRNPNTIKVSKKLTVDAQKAPNDCKS